MPKTNPSGAEEQQAARDFPNFGKLPPELRLMIYKLNLKETFPGPQLVIYFRPADRDPCDSLEVFDDTEACQPVPTALMINKEYREETLKKYKPITDKQDTWKRYMNFDTDTLLLMPYWRGAGEDDLPKDSDKIKHLMIPVHYYDYPPSCDGNDMSEMSDEVEWDFLRKSFPNLEELVIWTSDVLICQEDEDEPASRYKLVEHLARIHEMPKPPPDPNRDVPWWESEWYRSPKLDFPWWDSNPDLHSVCFKDIESETSGDYREIRDVTEKQFALVKRAHPEWPLKKIRFVGGLQITYNDGR